MTAPFARTPLDGIGARLVAVGIALVAGGLAVWIHRHELFPAEQSNATAGGDPFQECVTSRAGDIDKMLAEKTIDAQRAELFRARAEAMCRAEADKAAGKAPGLPPGLTPTQKF
jgi:hypothetical protein